MIITYYWPPSGGSGVQRWVKFTKYLRDFGWEPIIYTPSNPERPAIDHSLESDIPKDITVLSQPILEPYSLYKKFVGLDKNEKLGPSLMKTGNESSIFQDFSIWARGNFFIPDARKFWIKPSVRYLKLYLQEHSVDAIVSTGPPHSMHIIALKISKKFKIPWLSDFRDPWTNIDFFEDLKLTKPARKKHYRLEKEVLNVADKIVVVSPTMKKEFEEITFKPISVITNGYDEDDFDNSDHSPNPFFMLSHIGMMTSSRNPENLWKSLAELKESSPSFRENFKFQIIGKTDSSVRGRIEKYSLQDLIDIMDYIPHNEVINKQQNSDALLLIVNNTPNAASILTGKLFEYLAAKKPILCISPVKGDVSEIIKETNSGKLVLYSEKEQLKKEILRLYSNWQKGNSTYSGENIEQYSRKNLTRILAHELNSITG